jgi:hypothetical protein
MTIDKSMQPAAVETITRPSRLASLAPQDEDGLSNGVKNGPHPEERFGATRQSPSEHTPHEAASLRSQ